MKNKPPAFQFYAADFLVGTATMSNEEVGIYIRLLCHQWDKGFVPKDKAARIVGVKKIPADVLSKFVETNGEFRNERLERVRKEQAEYHEQQSLRGKAGAQARWKPARDGTGYAGANGEPMAPPSSGQCQNDSSPSSSPTPSSNPITTTIPDEWLVVVNELKIYGCWDEPIQTSITIARQKGLTPQTVSGLIRFAAAKVIALDADGRPVSQWEMPSGDELETASVPHGRIYRWGPPMLLLRIGNQEPQTGIADGWPGKSDKTAAYDEAVRKLSTQRGSATTPAQAIDTDEKRQAAEALAREKTALEAQYAAPLSQLTKSEAIDTLTRHNAFHGSQCRRSGIDPRDDSLFRLTILRAFAAGVASECTLATTNGTTSETDATANRAPTAQPPPPIASATKHERTPHSNEASALRSAQSP